MTNNSSPVDIESFSVTSEEAGLRLDKLLATRFPTYSRSYFQYLIEEGCVLVNGHVHKKRVKPLATDEIELCFQLTPELSLEPEPIPLSILYEDEHLLAINKPAGLVVHPACGHPSGTFVNALLYHCKNLACTDPLRPGIVHRLDKDTTGILLAAKTPLAHKHLVQAFASRTIDKRYLAITVGKPPDGLIDAPIKRHPTHRKEMTVCLKEGKPAQSHCRLIESTPSLSLVEIKLITGRTHQIRVHLQFKGTPVLGDPVYGIPSANKKWQASSQYLHAHQISFLHPISQQPLHLYAPPPPEFAVLFPLAQII